MFKPIGSRLEPLGIVIKKNNKMKAALAKMKEYTGQGVHWLRDCFGILDESASLRLSG